MALILLQPNSKIPSLGCDSIHTKPHDNTRFQALYDPAEYNTKAQQWVATGLANIGLTLEKWLGIDYDERNDLDGSAKEIYEKLKALPIKWAEQATASGDGRHLLAKIPEELQGKVKSVLSENRALDIRTGAHAYFVLAPSYVNGRQYTVISDTSFVGADTLNEEQINTIYAIHSPIANRQADTNQLALPTDPAGFVEKAINNNTTATDYSIEKLQNDLKYISSDIPYDQWRDVIFGATHQFGDDARVREILKEWSKQSDRYEQFAFMNCHRSGVQRAKEKVTTRPVTIRTVIKQANAKRKELGAIAPPPPPPQQAAPQTKRRPQRKPTNYELVFRPFGLTPYSDQLIKNLENCPTDVRTKGELNITYFAPCDALYNAFIACCGVRLMRSESTLRVLYYVHQDGKPADKNYAAITDATTKATERSRDAVGWALRELNKHAAHLTHYFDKAARAYLADRIKEYIVASKEEDDIPTIEQIDIFAQALIDARDNGNEWDGVDRFPLLKQYINPDFGFFGINAADQARYDDLVFGEKGILKMSLLNYAARIFPFGDDTIGGNYMPLVIGMGGMGKSALVQILAEGDRDGKYANLKQLTAHLSGIVATPRRQSVNVNSGKEDTLESACMNGGIKEVAEMTETVVSAMRSIAKKNTTRQTQLIERFKQLVTEDYVELRRLYSNTESVRNKYLLFGTGNRVEDNNAPADLFHLCRNTRRIFPIPALGGHREGFDGIHELSKNWLQLWMQIMHTVETKQPIDHTPNEIEHIVITLSDIDLGIQRNAAQMRTGSVPKHHIQTGVYIAPSKGRIKVLVCAPRGHGENKKRERRAFMDVFLEPQGKTFIPVPDDQTHTVIEQTMGNNNAERGRKVDSVRYSYTLYVSPEKADEIKGRPELRVRFEDENNVKIEL